MNAMRLVAPLVTMALVSVACGRSGLYERHALPVAVISPPDQTTVVGQKVVLRGLASSDPEGGALQFTWAIGARPAGGSAQLTQAGLPEVELTPDRPGLWSVSLEVAAGGRRSDPAAATVTALAARNSPPRANAGPAQSGTVGALVRLDGTASADADGDPLTFQWIVLAQPLASLLLLSDARAVSPSFTPPVPGDYRFQLQVWDDHGQSDVDSTQVIVASAGPDAGVDAGVDGGRPDAGVDGGRADGGLDAGNRDAGVDAGFDAGARDGGLDGGTYPNDGGGPELLDPAELYLAGTLQEGACDRDALVHWSTPNLASAGFDCSFYRQSTQIRPTDGRLLYLNSFEDKLREYHCDACTYSGTYPGSVLANDPIIPAVCPGTDGVIRFRVAVDGAVLHACSQSQLFWRDAAGTVVYDETGDPLQGLGNAGWMLTQKKVINTQTMVINPITGYPAVASVMAVRWNPPDAFWVAIDEGFSQRLWKVSTSGAAQPQGVYSSVPSAFTTMQTPRLNSTGALFAIYHDSTFSLRDVILRRTPNGATDVVYTEATNPLVKIHISALATGP